MASEKKKLLGASFPVKQCAFAKCNDAGSMLVLSLYTVSQQQLQEWIALIKSHSIIRPHKLK